MTTIGILLALIAALSIQAALSANTNDKNKTSLQEILANWIRSQDPFHHWTKKSNVVHDDISLQLNVVEWVRENGGYFNEKQEFRRTIPGNPETPFGVFATQRIQEGELLASVPWKCIMTAGTDEFDTYMHCNTAQFIIDEMRKGDESFFAPYTRYLLSAPPVHIPSTYTQEGKKIFKQMIGTKQLPPKRATLWKDKYWKKECHGSDDPFEIQAAMQLVSRGDDDTLTPVYDMYNHRNGNWLNTKPKMIRDKRHEMYASQTIEKGQEIYLSYNQCSDCWNRHYDFGTPEMFRDYGFVEQYPQRWIFHRQEIAFDIDENDENGGLELKWLDDSVDKEFEKRYEVTEWGIGVLKSHLRRLKEMYTEELKPLVKGASDIVIPQQELDSLMSYYNALTTALEMAVESSKDYLAAEETGDDGDDED